MRFSKYIVGPVAETLSEMRPIRYAEIVEFDRKIREFDNPPFDLGKDGKVDLYNIQGHLWSIYKDIGMSFPSSLPLCSVSLSLASPALLFLPRNFFARAMIKHSDNPLRSPFAPSFLSAYACSIKLLRTVRNCYNYSGPMLVRMWPIWAHTLTSGVSFPSPSFPFFPRTCAHWLFISFSFQLFGMRH